MITPPGALGTCLYSDEKEPHRWQVGYMDEVEYYFILNTYKERKYIDV
jgi:hypothetical protein